MRPLAADAVIIKNKKILLIKRGREPFKGMWALPGGLLEENETIEQCAKREAKEETSLNVKPEKLIGVYSDTSRDPRKVVSVAFICGIESGEEKAGDDASDTEWFDIEKIPELAADHNKIIKDALKLISPPSSLQP